MARRSSDRPTTVPGAVKDATARLDEVHRQQGRGAPALRGRGQVIEVASAGGRPMLNPRGVGSAVRFDDDGMTVTGTDGATRGNLRSQHVSATGDLAADGAVIGDNYQVTGNAIRCMSVDGALRWDDDGAMAIANRSGSELRGLRTSRVAAPVLDTSQLLADVRARGANWSSAFFDGAITWSGPPTDGALLVRNYAGNEYRGIYCSRLEQVGATSWSWSKTDHVALDDALGMSTGDLVDRAAAGVSGWRHDPEVVPDIATGEQRIGLMLDDLPEVLINRVEVHARDGNGDETGEMLDRSSWDVRGVVSALLVEIAALRRRVEHLERVGPAPIV